MPSETIPNTVAWEDILCELKKAEKPLTSAAVAKLLKQRTGKAFKPTLDSEVQAGRIHSWGNDLYLAADPKAIARERLLRLTATEVLTATPLDKRAAKEIPKISHRVVGEVRRDLVREKLLREKAPRHGSKNRAKLLVNFRNPEPYLEEAIGWLLEEFEVVRSEERIRICAGHDCDLLSPQSAAGVGLHSEGDLRQSGVTAAAGAPSAFGGPRSRRAFAKRATGRVRHRRAGNLLCLYLRSLTRPEFRSS